MTKTWLMRRPVRRPVSCATTAPSSSSVCRLPFISSSASPARTSATAFAAARVAVRGIDDPDVGEVDAVLGGERLDLGGRADEDRRDQALRRRPRRPPRAPSARTDARPPSAPARGCGTAPAAPRTCRSRSLLCQLPVSWSPSSRPGPAPGDAVKSKARAPDTGAPPPGKLDFSGYCGAVPVERPGASARVEIARNPRARPPVREPRCRGERRPRDHLGDFLVAVLAVAADGRAIAGRVRVVVAAEAAVRGHVARGCPGRCPRSPSSSGNTLRR